MPGDLKVEKNNKKKKNKQKKEKFVHNGLRNYGK